MQPGLWFQELTVHPGAVFLAHGSFQKFIPCAFTHKSLVWGIIPPNTDANYNRDTNKNKFNRNLHAWDRG